MPRTILTAAQVPQALEKLSSFREVWLVTFEYDRPAGEPPRPTRLIAREARSGRTLDIGPGGLHSPPFATEGSSLFVAYDAPAALGCLLTLGWTCPPTSSTWRRSSAATSRGSTSPATGASPGP